MKVNAISKLTTILGYVLFLNFFFFHSLGGMSSVLMFFGRFLFVTLIFKSLIDIKKNPFQFVGFLIALVLVSIGLLFRASFFVQSVFSFASAMTLYVYVYILSSEIFMVRSLFELILAPFYFLGTYIKTFFRTLKIIFTGDFKQIGLEKSQSGKKFFAQSLIIGLGIGLFVIGVLISMLSSADPIFASFIRKIVSADFLQNLFLRVVLSFFLLFLLLPYVILKRKSLFNSPLSLFKKINFVNEMTVVMILVILVMGVFLAIQWPYVFVKVPFETDLSKFGVATYSEYVRKGFVELLKVSLFVYGLIWAGLIILRESQFKKSALKYIQLILLGEFFVFLFSIFRRVWLYQSYHGWSLIRIYGSFFLFWIFGISIFLALRHFWQKRFVIGEILFTVAVVFVIGLFNVESFIVNNHPPTVNKKVDYVYLSRLSADGYEGWEKAFNTAKKTIEKYQFKKGDLNRDERKEIAYAGIIIRELSGNYRDLVKEYGSLDAQKKYLLSILNFQREGNYKGYGNDYLNEVKDKINKDEINYKDVFGTINISTSEEKYKFSTYKVGFAYTNQSFYDIYNYSYYPFKTKKNSKNKDSKLDRFFTWNSSKVRAYKRMIKDGRHNELLQLQGKYFELYRRILSQPQNERDFDMDISLSSPLLD